MRTLTDLSAYFHNRPYVNGTILSPVQCLLPIGYMPNKILEYKKHKSIFGFGRPLGQDIFCIFVIYLEYVNWLQCTNISSLFITIYSRHLYFSSQLILTYSSIYDDFDGFLSYDQTSKQTDNQRLLLAKYSLKIHRCLEIKSPTN